MVIAEWTVPEVAAATPAPGRRRTWLALATPLVVLSALVVLLSVTVTYVAHRLHVAAPGSAPIPALRWFDVNSERNVPTAWSALLLLTSGAVATLLAVHGRRASTASSGWMLVAATCGYLALDETFELHERLGGLGDAVAGERLHFAWVVPGAVLACVVGLVLLQRLRSQPAEVRRRLGLAAGVYLSGALVLETLSGLVLRTHGGGGKAHLAVTAAEEGCEMAGASLLLAALLHQVLVLRVVPSRTDLPLPRTPVRSDLTRSRAGTPAAPAGRAPRPRAGTAPRPSRATRGA